MTALSPSAPRRAARAGLATLVIAALAACGGGGTSAETAPRAERAPEPSPDASGAMSTAANTISEKDLKYAQYGRMEDMLARVPGLQVVRSNNGGFTLKIRGIQTFTGTGEPLVVLDGMQVRTGGISSTLAAIHPRDVTRVEVLKDTGSTAFYGSSGANGVIVITTRRGKP